MERTYSRAFNYSYVVDTSDEDPEKESLIQKTQVLVANSAEFDTWLNEVVFDLENFRESGEGKSALDRLEKLYQNSETGMTQEKYLELMEQLGKTPNAEEMPPL